MLKKDSSIKAFKSLFGPLTIEVDGVPVQIEPLTIRSAGKFTAIVQKVLPKLMGTDLTDSVVLEALLPLAFSDLVDLCNDCVDVDLKEIPHWLVPEIVQAWLDLSFGAAGKVQPWKNLFLEMQAKFSQSTAATSNPTSSEGSTSSSAPATT
jgi:hypothetical protein